MVRPADDTTLTDRVAIVTGGSRGLGREVTRALAGRGYAVVVHYAGNQRAADATVEEVLTANGAALTVRADVADELDVARLFAETIEAFGGVDVVVHAVGRIVLGPGADLDTFDALLPTSARGIFVVNRHAARELRDGGAIVHVFGSVVGLALPSRVADTASERAIEAITRVLSRELRGRDITLNAVALDCPGIAADIVNVVAFLVSRAGHGVNGQVIRFNGGLP